MAADSCQIGQVCGGAGWGGVLERLEGLVLLEALREMLGSLCIESVVLETANEKGMGWSGAADSCQIGQVCVEGNVLDCGEGGVRLQEVGDDPSTLRFQVIDAQTANESRVGVLMAADSQ